MRKLIVTVVLVAGLLLLGIISPSSADNNGGGKPVDGTGDITSVSSMDGLPPSIAEATMTDVLNEAILAVKCPDIDGPCDQPPRTCSSMVRDDRSSGPVPADAQQIQNIYFAPSDRDPRTFDRPVACTDGSRWESNIGYSAYNGRIWTRNTTNQNNRMNGRAFNHLFRNITAWGMTFPFYDVMFIRGNQNETYYGTDTFSRMKIELENRGWTRPSVKYAIYANVTAPNGEGGGRAVYNGKYGMAWLRTTNNLNVVSGQRWGCADQGDFAPMQETLHTFGAVQTAAPEHDWGHTYHTTQPADVMFWTGGTTYSGRWSNGAIVGETEWDPGLDSYTNRILTGFPGYLGTIHSGFELHTNCG